MNQFDKINIDTDVGRANMALHAINFNNLPHEDFKRGFKTREAIEYALSLDSVWLMIPDYADQAKGILNEMLEDESLGAVLSNDRQDVDLVGTIMASPLHTPPTFTPPVVLKTNKGEFKSIEVMKGNLQKMHPYIKDVDLGYIVDDSKVDLGMEISVDFLDEPMYTALIKIIKIKCDEDMIHQLGGISDIVDDVKEEEANLCDDIDGHIEPDIAEFPYHITTQAGVSYFKAWKEAVVFQKEHNKSNGTKLRATKRKGILS